MDILISLNPSPAIPLQQEMRTNPVLIFLNKVSKSLSRSVLSAQGPGRPSVLMYVSS